MTYDEIGNPLSYRHYTLTWQNGRQLASLQIMQLKINYTYDVDGLRTSKSVPNIDLEHKYTMSEAACSMRTEAMAMRCGTSTMRTALRRESATETTAES